MTKESKGLTRAREIYQNRPCRVKELKAEWRKIVGYLCLYPPLEMMTALGLVPYRIFGDMREPVTEADRGLPVSFCPFVRSCLDLGIKGKYDFLDGMVVAHACDAIEKTAHVWELYVKHPYFHFIDVPATIHKRAGDIFKQELKTWGKTLESFAGEKQSPEKLKQAIKIHNEQRALVRELYELKKPEPPLISGAETGLKCPRTFVEATEGEVRKDHMADLESRFSYLKDYATGWKVNGVILQSAKYCDCHGFEVPEVKYYIDRLGLPNTYLEHDYTEGSLAPLRTRVEALLEMIG